MCVKYERHVPEDIRFAILFETISYTELTIYHGGRAMFSWAYLARTPII
jgi:hypothetical protein